MKTVRHMLSPSCFAIPFTVIYDTPEIILTPFVFCPVLYYLILQPLLIFSYSLQCCSKSSFHQSVPFITRPINFTPHNVHATSYITTSMLSHLASASLLSNHLLSSHFSLIVFRISTCIALPIPCAEGSEWTLCFLDHIQGVGVHNARVEAYLWILCNPQCLPWSAYVITLAKQVRMYLIANDMSHARRTSGL